MLLLFVTRGDIAIKFSLLCLVSSFWLSGHLFLAKQFISEFIWVNVRWNGPTWQAKSFMKYERKAAETNRRVEARLHVWNDIQADQMF